MDFSLDEAISAQRALRGELGLQPERFAIPEFVGMISDEIEKMRAAGRTDADVAALIEKATGKAISPTEIGQHYATPDKRHPG